MVLSRAVTNGAMLRGHAFALTQKVEPRFHDEGFHEAVGLCRILKNAPADRAVAEAHVSQLVNGVRECHVIWLMNEIFDRHHHRPGLGMRLDHHLRSGTIELVWAYVRRLTAQNVKSTRDGNRKQQRDSRCEQRP